MDNLFFVQFLKKWKQVGAVAPSSPFLVKKMLGPVDFKNAKLIVELGAGSGSFTKEILRKMRPDAKLVVFEINDVFLKHLRAMKDSRMVVINDFARNIDKYLDGAKADCIVSGIPLSNLDKKMKEYLVSEVKNNLHDDGVFVQFQYLPESIYILKRYFANVALGFVPINIPPAFFYVCRKK